MVIGNQCRPRLDATWCGIWSGPAVFANRIFHRNRLDTPKITTKLFQHITVEESTSIRWVNVHLLSIPLYFNLNIVVLSWIYRKNSKYWDTLNYYRDCPTNGIVGFYSAILHSKDADRITNRVDTDQTAPWGAVWSGSALFARTYLSQYFKLLRYSLIKDYYIFKVDCWKRNSHCWCVSTRWLASE